MNIIKWATALCLAAVGAAGAQQRDTLRPRTKADSARADSIAKARRDSIALLRELEKAMAQPSTTAAPAQAPVQGVGPTNPRLLPDISVVGDFVGDLTPRATTQEDGTRLGVREVELAAQAAVDPYFRGDVFLGLNDLEKVSIEQAYLTTTSIRDLEIRLGRYLMPVGKLNTTHRHDLHTVEFPWVIQRFMGPEGMKGTGVYVSRVFAPFGFYQEVQLTAVDRFGETPEDLHTFEPVNKSLSGLAFSGRFRNYIDLTQNANLELSASAVTGRVERPLAGMLVVCPTCGRSEPIAITGDVNAVGARQTLGGLDFTYRWRPLQQGLYKSFMLQAEFMRQLNQRNPSLPECTLPNPSPGEGCVFVPSAARDFSGAYAFARYQISQRTFLGARYDWLQDPLDPEGLGRTLTAGSGYLEWFPSEFSKLVAAYERYMPPGAEAMNRILLQASFALGPHKPHPF
jgi:hypothetical protein